MTLSTSAVAVCCCRGIHVSSLSSRVFSMAMTVCAASLTSSICLSVKGRTSWSEYTDEAEEFITFQQWDRNARSNATYLYRLNYCRMAFVIRSCRSEVGNASGSFGGISFAKSGARRGIKGLASTRLAKAALCEATRVIPPSLLRYRVPNLASQMRTPFAYMALNTGFN